MLVIRGAYHFRPKRVAFRDDYCLSCGAPCRSIAFRTFDVGHVYWIPILPVGYWRHWVCSTCGRKPHKNPKMRRYFRWTALGSLVGASISLWALPVDSSFAIVSWVARFAAPAGAIFLSIRLLGVSRDLSLRKKLKSIPPTSDTVCPFCAVRLIAGTSSRFSCPACQIVRY